VGVGFGFRILHSRLLLVSGVQLSKIAKLQVAINCLQFVCSALRILFTAQFGFVSVQKIAAVLKNFALVFGFWLLAFTVPARVKDKP